MFVGHDIDPEIVVARHGAIFCVFMRVGEKYSLSVMSSVSRDISNFPKSSERFLDFRSE